MVRFDAIAGVGETSLSLSVREVGWFSLKLARELIISNESAELGGSAVDLLAVIEY